MNPETLTGTTDRRVAGLLALLGKNATIVISGARIAREIGVSRSTVWRWVERLRELGVKVKGQAATGYRAAERAARPVHQRQDHQHTSRDAHRAGQRW